MPPIVPKNPDKIWLNFVIISGYSTIDHTTLERLILHMNYTMNSYLLTLEQKLQTL